MNYEIYNENCLTGMKKIADGSVDAIICDLPFGTTDLPQDKKIPVTDMWKEFLRVTKKNAAIVLFSQMPFGAELISSNPSMFRYEFIYQKVLPTGFLNANKMPMRAHENILVFYRHLPTYNIQWGWSSPYKAKTGSQPTSNYRRQERKPRDSDGRRYPVDVLKFNQPISNAEKSWHPQQKPIDLLEYLIKTYTNDGELVLDATMGSGSTGIACMNTGRRFIGFELDAHYFDVAQIRMKEAAERWERAINLMSKSKTDIVEKATGELIPYENNARDNDGAVDAVAKSIAEFGFQVPIIIDSGNVIVAGHTRLKAAQKLGLEKVPCLIADDLTAEEIKAFRLIENKTNELADWDNQALNVELSELTDFNMQEFGFDVSKLQSVEISGAELSAENHASTAQGVPKADYELTVLLHKEQAKLIREAMKAVGEPKGVGHAQKAGNAIYEIIRQWTEIKK